MSSSAVYAATLNLDREVPDDTTDNTNITIHVEDKSGDQARSTAGHTSCGEIVAWFARSNIVRYLVVLSIISILIILLERFIGFSAVSDQLRSILASNIGEVVQAALSLHPNTTRIPLG